MVRTHVIFFLEDGSGGKVKLVECAGDSTDTKPTSRIATGSKFKEVDTGKKYRYSEDSDSWIQQ